MSFPPSKKSTQLDRHSPRPRSQPRVASGPITLNITSLIDMFTILLIFLLVNFSSDETVNLAPDLSLPTSSEADGEKRVSVPVAVTRNSILVDGQAIAELGVVQDQEMMVIPQLVQALNVQRERAQRVARLVSGQSAESGGEPREGAIEWQGRVTLQGDAELPFELLERVIYSCGQASFDEVSLAVAKVARDES